MAHSPDLGGLVRAAAIQGSVGLPPPPWLAGRFISSIRHGVRVGSGTGDERPYGYVSRKQVKELIGDMLEQDLPVKHVVDELQRTYEPFFLIPDVACARNCEHDWRELLGDRVICMEDLTDTVDVAAGLVGLCEGAFSDLDALARHLRNQDTTRQRLGAVIRALTPFAATLGRDGTPRPRLEDEYLPTNDCDSGHRRLR